MSTFTLFRVYTVFSVNVLYTNKLTVPYPLPVDIRPHILTYRHLEWLIVPNDVTMVTIKVVNITTILGIKADGWIK